jgi:magnesium-transporting ATPase (P-type)
MDKKFIVSVIVIFVLSMVFGLVNHGLVLSEEYQATGLFRPPAEAEAYFMWMLLAHLVMAFAFVWIYRRGHEARPWVQQGIRFGVIVALLMAVPVYLIYYAVQPMPELLVFRQIAYDTVGLVVMGMAVAFMYKSA